MEIFISLLVSFLASAAIASAPSISQVAEDLYGKNDFPQALELWKEVYKNQPYSVEAVIRVSELQLLLEGHEVAQKTLLDFIGEKHTLMPSSNLTIVYEKLNQFQNRFIKDESQSLYFQALSKIKLQDINQALSLLNQANRIEKGNFKILEAKSRCEKDLAQYSNYYETLKSANDLILVNQSWNDSLLEAQYYFKDLSDILSWHQNHASSSLSVRQKVAVAMTLAERGENREATALLFQITEKLKRPSQYPVVWYGLAWVHRKQANLKPAIQYFEKFLSIVSKSNRPAIEGWDPYRIAEKVAESKQWLFEAQKGQ